MSPRVVDVVGRVAKVNSAGDCAVLVQQLDPGLPLPKYAHPGDAGADVHSAIDFVLAPGERKLVSTGIAIAIPEGYAAFVHPRSGLAAKHGISIVNTPGTIDSGYRGEVMVCLINTDPVQEFAVCRGDRIAQLVIQKVETANFEVVDSLEETARGVGGYGSTGGFSATQQGGAG